MSVGLGLSLVAQASIVTCAQRAFNRPDWQNVCAEFAACNCSSCVRVIDIGFGIKVALQLQQLPTHVFEPGIRSHDINLRIRIAQPAATKQFAESLKLTC